MSHVAVVPNVATNDPAKPNYERPEVVAAKPLQHLVRDLLGGTETMHARHASYVHKWSDEAPETYRFRATCEQVYEGLGRTISAAIGMLFATAPALTFPTREDELTAHLENIDGAGNNFNVFAKRFSESALTYGHALILVDHPAPPEGVAVTAANEAALNLRPVWRRYDRQSVLSWRVGIVDNREQLTQVVLYEPTVSAANTFGIGSVHRFRVLTLVETATGRTATWRTFEMNTKGDVLPVAEGVYADRTGTPLPLLPIAVGYAGRTDAPLVSRPPLAGVAYANLGHWQQASNLRFYREVAAFPQPTVIGTLKDAQGNPTSALPLGPLAGVHLADGGSYTWTELQGTSLAQVEAGVREKEQQMAALGMSFLSRDTRAAETAEAKRLDSTAENSTLATAAEGLEDALDMAAEIHCLYMGMEKEEAFSVTLTKDYEQVGLSAPEVTAIAALVREGMPVRQAVQVLVAGGILVAETTEAEDDIVMEWETGRAAAADNAAMQAEANAAPFPAPVAG